VRFEHGNIQKREPNSFATLAAKGEGASGLAVGDVRLPVLLVVHQIGRGFRDGVTGAKHGVKTKDASALLQVGIICDRSAPPFEKESNVVLTIRRITMAS